MCACWHTRSTDLSSTKHPSRTFCTLWSFLHTQPQCYGDLQTQEASTVIILMLSWLIVETERGRAMVGTLHSKQRPEACVDRGLPCFVSWLLHAQLGNAASLGILDVWYVFYSSGLWDASSKAFFWFGSQPTSVGLRCLFWVSVSGLASLIPASWGCL